MNPALYPLNCGVHTDKVVGAICPQLYRRDSVVNEVLPVSGVDGSKVLPSP